MEPLKYRVISHSEIDDNIRAIFAQKLGKQGKVKGDLSKKADRCKVLCIVLDEGTVAAIGAIKKATASDFGADKADLPELLGVFEWEIGYLFTEPSYEGKGIGSTVVRLMTDSYGPGCLMATTEISANPGMVRILEKNGFKLSGKSWRSGIHSELLGLFLRTG